MPRSEDKALRKKDRKRPRSTASDGQAPPPPTSSQTTELTLGRCDSVTERYRKLGRLGEGTYGIVYQAVDRQTKAKVALKRCIPHHQETDGFPITTLREIQALRRCRGHPNIVHLHDVAVSESGGVFLVFEYCEHDLAQLLDMHFERHKQSPFAPAAAKTLWQHLLRALGHMHEHALIHRDVKLSNLLYTNRGVLKLADFGLSRPYAPQLAHLTLNVASLWYRPPELLLGSTTYSTSIDIWAAGCCAAELILGSPLFRGQTELDQIGKIFLILGGNPAHDWPGIAALPAVRDGTIALPGLGMSHLLDQFGSKLSSDGLDLLTRLLALDPSQRCTASKSLEATYFQSEPLPLKEDQMPSFSLVGKA